MGISINLFPSEKKDPIKQIVGNAPENLDTLEEIAAQLKNAGSAGKTVLDFTKITDEEWLQIQQDENYTPDLIIFNDLQVSPKRIIKGTNKWVLEEAIISDYDVNHSWSAPCNWYLKLNLILWIEDKNIVVSSFGSFIPVCLFRSKHESYVIESILSKLDISISIVYRYGDGTYDLPMPELDRGIFVEGTLITFKNNSYEWNNSSDYGYATSFQDLPYEIQQLGALGFILGVFPNMPVSRVPLEEFYNLDPDNIDISKYEVQVDLPWFGKTVCDCKLMTIMGEENVPCFVPKQDLIHDNIKISNVVVDGDELSVYDSPCKIQAVYLDPLLPFITSHDWNRLFYSYHCDIEIVEPGSVTAIWEGILYRGYSNDYAIICTAFGSAARQIYIKDGEVVESADFWDNGGIITSGNNLVNSAWDYAIRQNLIQIPKNLHYQYESLLKNYPGNVIFDTTHEWANDFLTQSQNFYEIPNEIKLPDPFKIKLLSEGVRKDDTIYYEKVTLYQENVWDYTGPLELYVDTDYKVKFRIPENKLDIIINFKTTYETQETMLSNFFSLDFIKNLSENRIYQLNFTTSGATGEWLMYTVLIIEGEVVIMDYTLALRAHSNYLNLVEALSSDPMDDAVLGNSNNKTLTYIQEAQKYGLFQRGMFAIIAMQLSN